MKIDLTTPEEYAARTREYRAVIKDADPMLAQGKIVQPPELPFAIRAGFDGYQIADSPDHLGDRARLDPTEVHHFVAAVLAAVGNQRYVVVDLQHQYD